MPNNNNDPSRPQEPDGPGAGHMKPWWIVTVAVYLVLVSVFVIYGLVKLWPYPTPSGERPTDQVAATQPQPSQSNPSDNSQALTGNAGGSTNHRHHPGILPVLRQLLPSDPVAHNRPRIILPVPTPVNQDQLKHRMAMLGA
jgi:hypothetical protein